MSHATQDSDSTTLSTSDRKALARIAKGGPFHVEYALGIIGKARALRLLNARYLRHDDPYEWGILDLTDAGRAALDAASAEGGA